MPTTTVTTESPPLAACVRERIQQLHDRGVRTVNAGSEYLR